MSQVLVSPPSQVVQAAQRPIGKFAVVVIDMYKTSLSCMRSAAEPFLSKTPEGMAACVSRVSELITEARKLSAPIFLVRELGCEVMPEFVEASGGTAIELGKLNSSAFGIIMDPHGDGDSAAHISFDGILKKLGIATLVLTGFNLNCCVLLTAKDALSNGYNVLTSPELLFGTNAAVSNPTLLDGMLMFYEFKTRYYGKLESLLADLRGSIHA